MPQVLSATRKLVCVQEIDLLKNQFTRLSNAMEAKIWNSRASLLGDYDCSKAQNKIKSRNTKIHIAKNGIGPEYELKHLDKAIITLRFIKS